MKLLINSSDILKTIGDVPIPSGYTDVYSQYTGNINLLNLNRYVYEWNGTDDFNIIEDKQETIYDLIESNIDFPSSGSSINIENLQIEWINDTQMKVLSGLKIKLDNDEIIELTSDITETISIDDSNEGWYELYIGKKSDNSIDTEYIEYNGNLSNLINYRKILSFYAYDDGANCSIKRFLMKMYGEIQVIEWNVNQNDKEIASFSPDSNGDYISCGNFIPPSTKKGIFYGYIIDNNNGWGTYLEIGNELFNNEIFSIETGRRAESQYVYTEMETNGNRELYVYASSNRLDLYLYCKGYEEKL